MSSIYIKAASLLFQILHSEEQHRHVPLFVCHRGLFDCVAPRIEQIFPTERGYQFNASRTIQIASNACTYHLTLDADFTMRAKEDVGIVMGALRKLTQVASLKLLCCANVEMNMPLVAVELKRFSLTLTKLRFFSHFVCRPDIKEIACAELRNLKELHVPSLTPELCKAIAAGPGARLHELRTLLVECQPTDVDELVAGCPNIWSLDFVDYCPFEFVSCASKLRYLQTLKLMVDTLPLETELRSCFSNMAQLTQLDLSFYVSIGFSCEAIIASTAGPQLVELALTSPLSSDAFSVLCCAASFPELQRLFLSARNRAVISDDVTVSLPPSLLKLELHNFELAPRTLTQLLSKKPSLQLVKFAGMTLSRRRGRNDDNGNDDEAASAQTVASEDDDWFGQLVKCPAQRLDIGGMNLAASIDTRIALLAPTLMSMSLDIDDWPAAQRDKFLGALFSQCVLLERVSYLPSGPSTAIDTTVAISGLRNNERLRSLEVRCELNSASALVDELLAMRSTQLHQLSLVTYLDIEQCIALAERFAHLE